MCVCVYIYIYIYIYMVHKIITNFDKIRLNCEICEQIKLFLEQLNPN